MKKNWEKRESYRQKKTENNVSTEDRMEMLARQDSKNLTHRIIIVLFRRQIFIFLVNHLWRFSCGFYANSDDSFCNRWKLDIILTLFPVVWKNELLFFFSKLWLIYSFECWTTLTSWMGFDFWMWIEFSFPFWEWWKEFAITPLIKTICLLLDSFPVLKSNL